MAKVKTYEDKDISQLAKDLVRTWKSKIESQRGAKKKECKFTFSSKENDIMC